MYKGLISKNNVSHVPRTSERDILESICLRDERSGKNVREIPITHVSRTSETNTM